MSNADWWAKQLGGQPAPVQQPRQDIPMPASQQPMTRYAPTPMQPDVSKAQSANQNIPCPECGGGNYMSPQPNIALRCYDCGYPVMQSGSRYGALTGAKVEGSAKDAKGNSGTSGFNPMPDGYNSQGQKI
jgi:hypothetical protein